MTEKLMNMLIIDDEEKLLFGLKAVMRREGYNVTTATNGKDGLASAIQDLPDVIICDVMMPPPNGFTLKKILMEDPRTANIPFIFLTARTIPADRIAGMRMGADDYITKPFQVDELLVRVKAILRRSELGRQRGLQEASSSLEQLRNSIATNLGHEMITPLSIVMSTLDLALRNKFGGSPEELEWYLKTAQSSANRLHSLVDDLILLNAIERGSVNKLRQMIDIKYNFLVPIKKILPQWADKHLDVKISVQPETIIHAPQIEFARAVCHLVENACKFSPMYGHVLIQLEKNGDGGCVLTVSDEGPGIPVELRENVFECYYQIDRSDARHYGGLGVGLTIARAIAETLKGNVVILDTTQGSKVRMIIAPAPLDLPANLSSEQNVSENIKG